MRIKAKESSLIVTVERLSRLAMTVAACSSEAKTLVLPQASGMSRNHDHLALMVREVITGFSSAS